MDASRASTARPTASESEHASEGSLNHGRPLEADDPAAPHAPPLLETPSADSAGVGRVRQLSSELVALLIAAPRLGFGDLQDRIDTDHVLADLMRELAVQLAARNGRMSLALSVIAAADELAHQAESLRARADSVPACVCRHPPTDHHQSGCRSSADDPCECRHATGYTVAQDRRDLARRLGLTVDRGDFRAAVLPPPPTVPTTPGPSAPHPPSATEEGEVDSQMLRLTHRLGSR